MGLDYSLATLALLQYKLAINACGCRWPGTRYVADSGCRDVDMCVESGHFSHRSVARGSRRQGVFDVAVMNSHSQKSRFVLNYLESSSQLGLWEGRFDTLELDR